MPKADTPLSAQEQSKRFKAELERLVAAGELDRDEAAATLAWFVKRAAERADKGN